MDSESFHGRTESSQLGENISQLLADNLEIGIFQFNEGDTSVTVVIIDRDFGQHIEVYEDDKSADTNFTTSISVSRIDENDNRPVINVLSTLVIDGQTTYQYWHKNMPGNDREGRFRDAMNETDVIRKIELAKSAKKQIVDKEPKS